MRLLLIVNNFPSENNPQDGVFNLRAACALRDKGFDVSALRFVPFATSMSRTLRGNRIPRERYDVEGVSVHIVRGLIGPRRLGLGFLHVTAGAPLARIIAEVKPDVVHAHGLLHAGLLALHADRPYILTGHGSETYALPWLRSGLTRLGERVVRGAAAVTAVSRFVGSHLERLGARDVAIVPNGADERVFWPVPPARNVRPKVFFGGNVVREKGVYELIDAVGQLSDLKPRLIIAGDGAERAGAEAYAAERAVEAAFLGRVSQQAVAAAMRDADVVALPSYAEGLPTVLCEAMLSGRAIVASDVGGIGEIVRDGVTGFLVPPHDSVALAGALRRVITNERQRREMEDAAVHYARQHLTWRSVATRYEMIYGKAMTACVGASEAGGAAPCVESVPPPSTS